MRGLREGKIRPHCPDRSMSRMVSLERWRRRLIWHIADHGPPHQRPRILHVDRRQSYDVFRVRRWQLLHGLIRSVFVMVSGGNKLPPPQYRNPPPRPPLLPAQRARAQAVATLRVPIACLATSLPRRGPPRASSARRSSTQHGTARRGRHHVTNASPPTTGTGGAAFRRPPA